jgi:DNA mismatch repair ATPase MutS
MLRDFGDPLIAREKRVLSSIRLGAGKRSDYPEGTGKRSDYPEGTGPANHAILTGPNRGGKSSLMRGILLNVRLAHAFGAAFAGKAQMSRFTWIADGLRLDDRPGKLSMFEREVCFAQAILTPRPGLGLCLYDELFHSTNPPDAARTSEVFCDALWKRNDCLSLVSTHVYALARGAPDSVKKVCVAAWGPGAGAAGAESAESAYSFSYTLQRGICEVSSVELLLQQHGLTGKQPQPRPRQATKLLPSDQK